MMDYLEGLTKHEDAEVRAAAITCLEVCKTPMWRGRQMRKYLSNLSWALYDYIKAKK
jgi:hypothetical protein